VLADGVDCGLQRIERLMRQQGCAPDRIVQRAMLMAMEPIWESDFHRLSCQHHVP
jgi:hypothetical protein